MPLIHDALDWWDSKWISETELRNMLLSINGAAFNQDRIQLLDRVGDVRLTVPNSHIWAIDSLFITTQTMPAADHYLDVEVLDRNGEYVWTYQSRIITAAENSSHSAFCSNGGDYSFTNGLGSASFGITWPFPIMREGWTILIDMPGIVNGYWSAYLVYRDVSLL